MWYSIRTPTICRLGVNLEEDILEKYIYVDVAYVLGNSYLPDGPKFSTKPSTQPDIQRALLTIFAKKNKVPIEPPNSGPSVLLIITIE